MEGRWANTPHPRLPWPKRGGPAQGRAREIHERRAKDALVQVVAQQPAERRWANPQHQRPLWPGPGPIRDSHERGSKEALAQAIAEQGIGEVAQLVNTGAPLLASYALDREGATMGTALELALLKKKDRLASQMLALPVDGPKLARGCTWAVLWAARDGKLQLLQGLLGARADVSQRDSQGRSALLLASTLGHTECARALLEAGAGEREASMEEVQRLLTSRELKQVSGTPRARDGMPNSGDSDVRAATRDELTLLRLDVTEDRWAKLVHERLPWQLRKG